MVDQRVVETLPSRCEPDVLPLSLLAQRKWWEREDSNLHAEALPPQGSVYCQFHHVPNLRSLGAMRLRSAAMGRCQGSHVLARKSFRNQFAPEEDGSPAETRTRISTLRGSRPVPVRRSGQCDFSQNRWRFALPCYCQFRTRGWSRTTSRGRVERPPHIVLAVS